MQLKTAVFFLPVYYLINAIEGTHIVQRVGSALAPAAKILHCAKELVVFHWYSPSTQLLAEHTNIKPLKMKRFIFRKGRKK